MVVFRYGAGRVLVKIQDFDAVDGFSTRCAASLRSALFFTDDNIHLGGITSSLMDRNLFLGREFRHLHAKATSQDRLRFVKDGLELPGALLPEYLGTDIGASDGEPRVLASQSKPHHLFYHNIDTTWASVVILALWFRLFVRRPTALRGPFGWDIIVFGAGSWRFIMVLFLKLGLEGFIGISKPKEHVNQESMLHGCSQRRTARRLRTSGIFPFYISMEIVLTISTISFRMKGSNISSQISSRTQASWTVLQF